MTKQTVCCKLFHIDGLVQEICNSIAYVFLALINRFIIYIIISKISTISSETEGPGASFMTRTLQLRFREFGAPIIYMIPVPLLT